MNPPVRLLISARDPGAANHLLPVIRHLDGHPSFDVRVIAAPPADQTFRAAGIDFESVSERDGALRHRVRQVLALTRPNAVLTGLSGPDSGLDEVLLAARGDIPGFAYQDFWGDVNLAGGRAADCYLVRDAYAAHLTRDRFGLNAVVVGPTEIPPAGLRLPRRRTQSTTRQVAWCGQPLWLVPGYASTFRRFARQFKDATLLVKPHPKEDARQRLHYRRLATGQIELWQDSLERLFERCELVASAFSNCALEQIVFNARPGAGYSVPVQLLCDRRLRATYREWTGIDRLPLAEQGLVLGITAGSRLEVELSPARLQRFRRASRRPQRRLPRSAGAEQRIVDLILERVRERASPALKSA